MRISDLERAGLRPLQPYADRPVSAGYTSDLLSDVMAHAPEGSVLITLQAHKNTVACAALAGVVALVLAGSRQAPDDLLEAARDEEVAVFASDLRQFELTVLVAGLLDTHLAQPETDTI